MARRILVIIILLLCLVSRAMAAGDYRGDDRCPPPKDWQGYSPPYNPLDHPDEFPTFNGADLPGWSCSYQREDGVVVQYGDSRSPQEQWLATYVDSVSQQ